MNPSSDPAKDPAAILKARARALARSPQKAAAAAASVEIVEFALADERYAIETSYIREVHPLEDITPLPCTPPFVRGLVNVRGRILPVIDLKKFFDLPEQGITDLHRILLVETEDLAFGLLADSVAGVHRIPLMSLQPSLPTLTGIRAEYLKGVTAAGLVVLAAAAIVADRRLVVHEEVEN